MVTIPLRFSSERRAWTHLAGSVGAEGSWVGGCTACSLRGSVVHTGWARDCSAGECTWYQNPPEVEHIGCRVRVELVSIQAENGTNFFFCIFTFFLFTLIAVKMVYCWPFTYLTQIKRKLEQYLGGLGVIVVCW